MSEDRLKATLGCDRWNCLQEEINTLREMRHTRPATPQHIIRAMRPYTEHLAEADRLTRLADHSRPTAVPSTKNQKLLTLRYGATIRGRTSRETYRRLAEHAYEKAIEKLQEIIEEFPTAVCFLDRDSIFDGDRFNVTPDPGGVPRLLNSRSPHKVGPKAPIGSARKLTISALQKLINDLSSTTA